MSKFFKVGFPIVVLAMICACGEAKKEEPVEPTEIRVIPETKTVEVGQSAVFKAVVLSSEDAEIAGADVTWSVEGDAGTVDQTGKFTGVNPGEAVLVARAMGISGSAQITVQMPLTAAPVEQTQAPEAGGEEIPVSILIQNEGYPNDRKGPVAFNHLSHAEDYGVACRECHHVYKDGENIWQKGDPVQKCAECHPPDKKEGDLPKLSSAFHRNCKNCHKELAQEGVSESAPWKKCTECHADGS